jgi:SAM-dependent methyltransferase
MIGLDAEPSSVECLRTAGFHGMVAEAETLPRIQLPDAPSVITMLDVLEHLEQPVDALRELRLIGGPGAVLVCLVPAMPFLWSEWDERLGHQRRYGAGLLRQHLGEAGWNVISVRHLFPSMVIPAIARRWMGVSSGADEFPEVSDPLNRILVRVNDLEHRFLRWPFGTSLAALAVS